MLVTVRHLPREAYRDISCIYDEGERLVFAKDQLKHNNYIRVADIEIKTHSINKALNLAFEVTNSIDVPWYLADDIDVAESAQEGCRSTSVGDIIQILGISYMVAGCGFTEIKGYI